MPDLYKTDQCDITWEEESAWGTAGSGARNRCYQHVTFAPGGRVDAGGSHPSLAYKLFKAKNLRFCDFTLAQMPFVFALWDHYFERILRSTLPGSALSLTDIFTIDKDGTQIDGTTGPTLVLGTGASAANLNDFTTYNGATKSGAAGMMAEISGFADGDNNYPRRIKDCDDNQIDFMPEYSTNGVTGQIGAEIVDAADDAGVTINIGKGIKVGPISAHKSINVEVDTNQTGTPFHLLTGGVPSTLALALSGNGFLLVGPFAHIAKGPVARAAATAGNGTITANANVVNSPMSGADNLAYMVVNGANQFAGAGGTNFQATINANVQPAPDSHGQSTRYDIKPGEIDITGMQFSYLDDDVLGAAMQTLIDSAPQAAASYVPFDFKIGDGTNNVWFGFPKCAINGGPLHGDAGGWGSAQLNLDPMGLSEDCGPIVYQTFAG